MFGSNCSLPLATEHFSIGGNRMSLCCVMLSWWLIRRESQLCNCFWNSLVTLRHCCIGLLCSISAAICCRCFLSYKPEVEMWHTWPSFYMSIHRIDDAEERWIPQSVMETAWTMRCMLTVYSRSDKPAISHCSHQIPTENQNTLIRLLTNQNGRERSGIL